MSLFLKSARLPTPSEALPGRDRPIPTAERHAVLGTPLAGPFPAGCEAVLFGMGCFWGAERLFWRVPGVYTTSVGYAGGFTPHPTYEEVCTGQTGHAEVVQVVFDPARVDFEELLRLFWESHDPTQGMRQGNDVGTQYRSVICTTTDGQLRQAEASRRRYQAALNAAGGRTITTEIWPSASYYLAEEYHQQYLHKNPNGYCGLAGCGISYR